MDFPEVKLEEYIAGGGIIKLPGILADAINPKREEFGQPIDFQIPRIKKLRLTKDSELAIFGNLDKYRDSLGPSLFDGYPPDEVKIALIDEENSIIYNKRLEKICSAELAEKRKINPGKVCVRRDSFDVFIENIDD